jgi:hypothetical protein
MFCLNLREDYDALQRDWREVISRIESPLEYAPDWIKASAESAGLLDDVCVFVERRGDAPTSFSPMLRTRLRTLGITCSGWEMPGLRLVSSHSGLVSEDGPRRYLARLVDNLPKPKDIVIMPAIVERSETEQAIHELCRDTSWRMDIIPGDESPYIPINTTWNSFLSGRNKKLRYTLRKKVETLPRLGEFSERWFHDHEAIDVLFDDMLVIEEQSWKVEAGLAISRREKEQRYYRYLLPFLADSAALVANVLYVDAEPIAYSLCYASQGRLAQLKTSFKEAYAHESPGLVAISHAIRYAFDNGFREFDFLGDAMPHKMQWTDSTRRHADYFLFGPRIKPRVVQSIKYLLARLRGGRKHAPTLGRGGRK